MAIQVGVNLIERLMPAAAEVLPKYPTNLSEPIRMSGINFLPSFCSTLFPALFILGLGLLCYAILWRREQKDLKGYRAESKISKQPFLIIPIIFLMTSIFM